LFKYSSYAESQASHGFPSTVPFPPLHVLFPHLPHMTTSWSQWSQYSHV
jgi:hypothetical protein